MRRTLITKQYSYTNYLRDRDNQSVLLFIEREDGSIEFFSEDKEIQAFAGDTVVALATPQKTIERVKERLDEEGAAKEENMKEVVDYYVEPTSLEETKGHKDLPGEAPPTIK